MTLATVLAPITAGATVLTIPAGVQRTLQVENQGGSDPWFYAFGSQTWSFTTNITGGFLDLGPTPGSFVVNDLAGGAYTVNASIDSNGDVTGGAFSWVSASTTLGITSPQIFLSGTVLGALQATAGGVPQLWASVDYTNPALTAWTTAPSFAVLSFIGAPCWQPCQSGDTFLQDRQGIVIQPDIFGYRVNVEEPSLAILFLLLIAAAGIERTRSFN